MATTTVAVKQKKATSDRFLPNSPSIASFKLHGEDNDVNNADKEHQDAIAKALRLQPLSKVLQYSVLKYNRSPLQSPCEINSLNRSLDVESEYSLAVENLGSKVKNTKQGKKIRNSVPYRSLDAPGLLNDYYCTLIAWSTVSGHLAVGLGSQIFLWTEYEGSHLLPLPDDYGPISCLAFSCSNILAIGRKDGSITCYDINENSIKTVYIHVEAAICFITWLPQSETDLFVGDEIGNVIVLKITTRDEISGYDELSIYRFSKLKCHTQQICGMAFSPDLTQLAVGGNDNLVTVWNISHLEKPVLQYKMAHKAAVKGLAFCPWIPSLLATGGGTHDRMIRFWHTRSGTLLDTYNVKGQITSITWSRHCKQLAITFGFGNHDRPLLVSVYSYPKFRPLIQVPTDSACRVISAVPSPDGACICMASTDETVRFFELWPSYQNRTTTPQVGMFGSDIIDMLEGLEKPGETIR